MGMGLVTDARSPGRCTPFFVGSVVEIFCYASLLINKDNSSTTHILFGDGNTFVLPMHVLLSTFGLSFYMF